MICEALILALNRHSYSVGNFLGYHKKSSSLFEKYIHHVIVFEDIRSLFFSPGISIIGSGFSSLRD